VQRCAAKNYIRSDESMKAQAIIKDRGRHTFIDKVKVSNVDSDYWTACTSPGERTRLQEQRLGHNARARPLALRR
jgi:ATP-dependent Lon protease